MKNKIEKFTLEQISLMRSYRDKWRSYVLSTERIDREKASLAVKALYAAIGFPQPQIVFFDSPLAALKKSPNILGSLQGSLLRSKIHKQLEIEPGTEIGKFVQNNLAGEAINQLKTQLKNPLAAQLGLQVGKSLWNLLRSQHGSANDNCIQPEIWVVYASAFDFCISVLNCAYSPPKWEALQSVVKECGWILPWKKTCFVCDRPTTLSFDSERRLHAEGEAAIEFTDGFKVYAYHGVTIPEKYGILSPHQWRSQWILEEQDLEVKQVLIHGIGRLRIRKELGNIDIDF